MGTQLTATGSISGKLSALFDQIVDALAEQQARTGVHVSDAVREVMELLHDDISALKSFDIGGLEPYFPRDEALRQVVRQAERLGEAVRRDGRLADRPFILSQNGQLSPIGNEESYPTIRAAIEGLISTARRRLEQIEHYLDAETDADDDALFRGDPVDDFEIRGRTDSSISLYERVSDALFGLYPDVRRNVPVGTYVVDFFVPAQSIPNGRALVFEVKDFKEPLPVRTLRVIYNEMHASVANIGRANVVIVTKNGITPEAKLFLQSRDDCFHFTIDELEERQLILKGGVKNIGTVTPNQKVAPAQFEIVSGRWAIVHQDASAGADAAIAAASRRGLIEIGQQIVDYLEGTNCDKRMLQVVKNLQGKLESQQDIVELGMFTTTCEVMAAQFAAELPDIVGSMLLAHVRNINSYLAQFPEWRKFAENAALVEISPADIQLMHRETNAFIQRLEKTPEIADPEVPKTLKFLNKLLADPNSVPKRAAFALLRTLENMWASAYGYAALALDSTIKKTIAAGSTVLALTLITVAAENADKLIPVTSKLADSHWVETATKIIKDAIKDIGEAKAE